MPGEEFQTSVRATANGTVVQLVGTVNRAAKEAMEQAYAEAAKTPGEIAFDFSAVDYINSTGIAVIVGVLAMARAENREIGAYGLSDHYKEVFEITRLADFMHIYEDAATAN